MEWVAAFAWVPLLVFILAISDGRRAADRRQARRMAELERNLDLVMAHLGLAKPESEASGAALEELRAGNKIKAIKVYREATGLGLKDAKEAVELLASRRGLG